MNPSLEFYQLIYFGLMTCYQMLNQNSLFKIFYQFIYDYLILLFIIKQLQQYFVLINQSSVLTFYFINHISQMHHLMDNSEKMEHCLEIIIIIINFQLFELISILMQSLMYSRIISIILTYLNLLLCIILIISLGVQEFCIN